tara:strand:- start:380 stop:748 length:369 start_codon:yes stop_codon:yes gene_type:complete
MTSFDHIEVFVNNIKDYIDFLKKLFEGGEIKKLSENGTSMFKSPEGLFIELKNKEIASKPILSGFCQPCLRKLNAKEFIDKNNLEIVSEAESTNGKIYFFKDHEGIIWHLKDYEDRDWTNNW